MSSSWIQPSKKKHRELPTLTGALLIPIPTRCAHKICLHSTEKRSYRAESVDEITSTREGKRDVRRERRQQGKTNGEKQRWDRKCASDRGGGRAKARWMRKKKKRNSEERKREERGGDGEWFHEESGWLTDDLIKRGTNYRPAGC